MFVLTIVTITIVINRTKLAALSSATKSLQNSCTAAASYPDVSLDVRAKEGGKETTGETSGRSCFQDGGKSNGGPIYNF